MQQLDFDFPSGALGSGSVDGASRAIGAPPPTSSAALGMEHLPSAQCQLTHKVHAKYSYRIAGDRQGRPRPPHARTPPLIAALGLHVGPSMADPPPAVQPLRGFVWSHDVDIYRPLVAVQSLGTLQVPLSIPSSFGDRHCTRLFRHHPGRLPRPVACMPVNPVCLKPAV